MDFVAQEHYRRKLTEDISLCPCRWWLQRYMVLTPMRHNNRDYKPGAILDGWQFAPSDIAGGMSGGALGVVEMRPTGILTGVEEALAQAERLLSLGISRDLPYHFWGAAYYGHDDGRRMQVWKVDTSFFVYEDSVDDEGDASEHENLEEVIMSLAFERLISPKAGWRPCFCKF